MQRNRVYVELELIDQIIGYQRRCEASASESDDDLFRLSFEIINFVDKRPLSEFRSGPFRFLLACEKR